VSRDLREPLDCRTQGIDCYEFAEHAWGRERLRKGYLRLAREPRSNDD
jgi:hypothetical protein